MTEAGTFGLIASLGLEGVASVELGAEPSMLVVDRGWVDRGEGRCNLSEICWSEGMRVMRCLRMSIGRNDRCEDCTHPGDEGTEGGAMLPFLGASSRFTSPTFVATRVAASIVFSGIAPTLATIERSKRSLKDRLSARCAVFVEHRLGACLRRVRFRPAIRLSSLLQQLAGSRVGQACSGVLALFRRSDDGRMQCCAPGGGRSFRVVGSDGEERSSNLALHLSTSAGKAIVDSM